MNKQEHLKVLQDRHAKLKNSVKKECNNVHPNEALLNGLKRKKLHLKEEIQRFLTSVES